MEIERRGIMNDEVKAVLRAFIKRPGDLGRNPFHTKEMQGR